MSEEFYITLPSKSSLKKFLNNSNNSYKVRLPRPMGLVANWKVALSSIALPDPKDAVPAWLREEVLPIYTSWYHTSDHSTKTKFQTSITLKDINRHVDVNMMTGHDLMKAVVDFLRKKQLGKDLTPG